MCKMMFKTNVYNPMEVFEDNVVGMINCFIFLEIILTF